GAEDGRQRPGLLAVGNHGDDAGALQGDAVEETQGADGLVEATPGGALAEQVELVLPRVLGAEVLRGAAKVLGEAGDGADITIDGPGAVVAQLQVMDEALTQGRHETPPDRAARAPLADMAGENARRDDKAQEQNQAATAGQSPARTTRGRGPSHRTAV